MTLNEKLELISELESAKFNTDTIERLVESIEHPENNNGPFNSIDELWDHLDKISEENKTSEKN